MFQTVNETYLTLKKHMRFKFKFNKASHILFAKSDSPVPDCELVASPGRATGPPPPLLFTSLALLPP